jgi:hypothetical protein
MTDDDDTTITPAMRERAAICAWLDMLRELGAGHDLMHAPCTVAGVLKAVADLIEAGAHARFYEAAARMRDGQTVQ